MFTMGWHLTFRFCVEDNVITYCHCCVPYFFFDYAFFGFLSIYISYHHKTNS
jgi:hypothetical protein